MHHFLPSAAVIDQIQHRQTENDDEVGTDAGTHRTNDFQAEADAVFKHATPLIVAMVGVRRDELVDQIAFRTHDFDAVVMGVLHHRCALGKVGNGLLNIGFGQFARRGWVDRCLDC